MEMVSAMQAEQPEFVAGYRSARVIVARPAGQRRSVATGRSLPELLNPAAPRPAMVALA